MKIYIASRFADREMLRPIRDKIWAMGHAVVNTWLDEVRKNHNQSKEEFWRKLAVKDLCEIASADLLIRNVRTMSHTGGADTEVGFALGRHHNAMIWLVGKPRNVFHTLADRTFADWDTCLKALKSYDPEQ